MIKKLLNIIQHSTYSLRIILPRKFCRELNITKKDKLECILDIENKQMILRKKDDNE